MALEPNLAFRLFLSFVNKVLLAHGHAHSVSCYLRWLLPSRGRAHPACKDRRSVSGPLRRATRSPQTSGEREAAVPTPPLCLHVPWFSRGASPRAPRPVLSLKGSQLGRRLHRSHPTPSGSGKTDFDRRPIRSVRQSGVWPLTSAPAMISRFVGSSPAPGFCADDAEPAREVSLSLSSCP